MHFSPLQAGKKNLYFTLNAFLKGISCFVLGEFLSLCGFFVGLYLIWPNVSEMRGVTGVFALLVFPVGLFKVEFWSAALIDYCLFSLVFQVFVTYKLTLTLIFRELWSTSLKTYTQVFLKNVFEHLSQKGVKWMTPSEKGAEFKDYISKKRLALKELPFFQRKLLTFGFEKLHMDELLSCKSEKQLAQTIGIQIDTAIEENLISTKRTFRRVIILEFVLVLIAFLMNH